MKKQYRNYMRDQKNKLHKKLDGQKALLIKLNESKINHEEKYGKYPELIKLGEVDRIGGHSPQIIDNEEMKKSYEYGFYIKGSRLLAGEFEKGTFSTEEQRNFGISDLSNGIKDEHLINLKDYPEYMNGRIYQMGRNIYYYIENNNFSIEEYIGLMSLVNEDINNPEFKNGYNDQKNEVEQTNKKGR